MKKLIVLISLIIAIGAVQALKFDPDTFVSRTIIACFSRDAVGNAAGTIHYSMKDGSVKTGLASFDKLSETYNFTGLDQAHPYVKLPTWNDNGTYLQNIYRIRLASDDLMDAALADLAKDPNLLWAEFEGINRSRLVPSDPMVGQQYAHTRLQSFDAWDYTLGSYDVKVAITDSGVKWNHPDLRANIWVNPAESPGMTINWDAGTISGGNGLDAGEGGLKIDDLVGWDFYNNDNNPIQTYSANDHGTHVAGCAGAVGNNAIGVTGTSPIVSIISCKGASNTSPSQGISYAYDQVKYAAEVGADIINASWGSTGTGAYPNSIVNYATNLGALVVAAAGNENMEHTASYQDYPADCTNALCVAATDQSDTRANFSDFGAPIDICAPGVGILSTIVAANGYDAYDGTSMASPVAAGVAALVKSMHPNMTPAQLKERLMATADYIYDINPNYVDKLGAGRINAFSATMYDKIPNITIEDQLLEEVDGDGDGVANPGELVRLKLSLNNYLDPFTGLAWLNAENLQATLTTTYPGVTIINSTASYGSLYPGSTMWNNNQPFTFQTVGTLASEPIPFELVLTANPTAPYPYNKTLPFTVELSLVQEGWPFALGGASNSSPILANLDSSSDFEIVFGDQAGNIHAVKPNGSAEIAGFPVSLGAAIVGSLAMSDVNNDGLKEFAASTQANNIVLIGQAGNTLWSIPAGGTLRSGPIIASLGMDNSRQIITATQTGNLIVLNGDSSYYPNFPASVGGAVLGPPTVADLDGDGQLEIIVATLNGNLSAISTLTGQNIPGFPVAMGGGTQNPITVADIDSDDLPEIIVATSTAGMILAYNHNGTVSFSRNVGGQIKTGPVFADVNNDGSKEIIVIGAAGIINVLNANGTDLAGTPINVNQAVECTPTVARFDGDNYAGIIFGDSNGLLHSVRVDGSESPNFPIALLGNIKVSAALGDIDQDGDFDIVIPNDASFFVMDIKRPAQSYDWYGFMGSWNRSGLLYGTTPNNDHSVPAAQTALTGNYPNPFNPSTQINFSLAEAGEVEIQIFNPKGQLVRTLVSGKLPAGSHSTAWDGRDDRQASVSSGVYFYRMHSGKYSSTRKMVMMK